MVASKILWTLLLILRLSLSGALRHSKVKGVSTVATVNDVRILKKHYDDDDEIMNAKEKNSENDSLSPTDEFTSPPEEDDEDDDEDDDDDDEDDEADTTPPGAPGTQAPAPTDAPADAPVSSPPVDGGGDPVESTDDEPVDEVDEPDDEVDESDLESFAPSAETDAPVDPRDETPADDDIDEFARYLYPFVVTIEAENLTSAMGIPTCLLEEMAENLPNIEDIVIETFSLINTGLVGDSESSIYAFNLEFGGYASFLGSPLHTTAYVQEIQGNVLGDIGFLQECIDSEDTDMELRVTAIEGEPETDDDDDDDTDYGMMKIWYLVGLAGGAMFLSCCLIVITSMVKSGDSVEK